MKRREDWDVRLNNFIKQNREARFDWDGRTGGLDCWTMPANAILQMTDVDFLAPWRGTYTDAAGAFDKIMRFGRGAQGALEKLARQHGWEEVPTPFKTLSRGDLCLLKPNGTDERFEGVLAICVSSWIAFMTEGGMGFTGSNLADGTSNILRAWHIP